MIFITEIGSVFYWAVRTGSLEAAMLIEIIGDLTVRIYDIERCFFICSNIDDVNIIINGE
jgi:hypothetical protein